MSQMSFGDAEYAGKRKQTRREVFLDEMEQVVPWESLLKLIEPFYPMAGRGRHPYPLETMLRMHLMQNWFGLSDPAMEEALYEITPMRAFAGLSLTKAIPDETTILNFRHLLEANELAPEILRRVNAYLRARGCCSSAGASWTRRSSRRRVRRRTREGERDPEMHQTKKGNQWHFGMKAHIGVDADSGLVHTVTTTPANEADVEVVDELLHGKEEVVHADCGLHRCRQARASARTCTWHIAAKRGTDQGDGGRTREACARASREGQGERAREGRASVPGDQAPVRFDEGALPRTGEEHGACDHAIRAVESVDGATAVVGDDGIVASSAIEKARSRSERPGHESQKPRFKHRHRRRQRATHPQIGL